MGDQSWWIVGPKCRIEIVADSALYAGIIGYSRSVVRLVSCSSRSLLGVLAIDYGSSAISEAFFKLACFEITE
jgi:hypothetical protein